MKSSERILWGVAVVGFLAGLVGLVQRITGGHTVAAYSSYVPWGLWVAMYAMLIGISIGAFLVAFLAYGARIKEVQPLGRIALQTALAALAGGMLAIWLDLGHPGRFLKLFFSVAFSSVMGPMAWLYTLYGLLLIALLYISIREPESETLRTLSWGGLLLAVVFGIFEGALFGVVSAQALWESALTPILFLVEGALSGVAMVWFLGILLERTGSNEGGLIHRLLVGLLATAIVFELVEFSTTMYAGIPAKTESLRLVFSGPFWWVFWIIHVGLGVVVPLALLVFLRGNKIAHLTAAGLIAATAVSTKLNLVIPALVVPEFAELRTAFTGLGLTFNYVPTTAELLLGVWFVSVSGLVFLAAYRFLPKEAAERIAS